MNEVWKFEFLIVQKRFDSVLLVNNFSDVKQLDL